jgi:exosortase
VQIRDANGAACEPATQAVEMTSLWTRVEQSAPVLLKTAILGTLLFLLYHRILQHLAEDWIDDPNYSYGFFVLIFCCGVLWKQRKTLQGTPRKPASIGLVIIGGALGILILGVYGAELYLSRTSLLFLIAGLVIYFLGWRMFKAVLFPWSVLLLTIPLPAIVFNQVSFPLQFEASRLASGLAGLARVPVLREGNVIVLPSLTLDVAEACSGLRSLMALITLAVFYGYVFESRVSRRLLLAFAAVPIAVMANAMRIMGSGVIGEYWGPDKAEGFFHLFSGGLVFVCSLLLLFGFHAALKPLSRVARWGQ